jgi:hypothetical protein
MQVSRRVELRFESWSRCERIVRARPTSPRNVLSRRLCDFTGDSAAPVSGAQISTDTAVAVK